MHSLIMVAYTGWLRGVEKYDDSTVEIHTTEATELTAMVTVCVCDCDCAELELGLTDRDYVM